MHLTWLEISTSALINNLKIFRKIIGNKRILAPAIKGNAYGHGLIECARVLSENDADFLCVNALYEAEKIRKAGIKIPLLIIGYVPLSDLEEAIHLNCDLTVYNIETLEGLKKINKPCRIHLKIETGCHRQGILLKDLPKILEFFKKNKNLNCIGLSTHFANIEDRIHYDYALRQLDYFKQAVKITKNNGIYPKYKHTANSAATLVLSESLFTFVRPGISMYGLWPSEKTKKAIRKLNLEIELKPVLTWKTKVIQIKEVEKNALISYGCTYKMPKKGIIAVLPIGYYDGFVRSLGNIGHVLINGKKAPVIGRICMNMMMVNISEIPNIKLEEEVVLIGKQGKEEITAEDLANWSGTINYEVTTRIPEHVPRILF